MPLPAPPVALLNFKQLVQNTLERVPSHTPEWTNLNDADPGVTIVQLFAFLTETLSYRANLIPDRNRIKFLQLLGVPLRAAQAATGLISFSNRRGPLAATALAAQTEVAAGRVPFRTVSALTVLPIEGRLYRKAPLDSARETGVKALYERLYGDLTQTGVALDFYEPRPFDPPTSGVTPQLLDVAADTVDGAAWIALLARPTETPDAARLVIANKVLTLAVMPALDDHTKDMPPQRSAGAASAAGFDFHVPRLVGSDVSYDPIEARPSADLTLEPGTVELRLPGADRLAWVEDLDPLESGVGDLPPSLADTDDGARLITWIRMKPRQGAARLFGVWLNSVEVTQRAWVPAETLPAGTGEPDQRVVLAQLPVLPDTLTLSVNGEAWLRTADLFNAAPEIQPTTSGLTDQRQSRNAAPAKSYTVDAESGEMRFGNGFQGMRPPRGATIVASYAYGGGSQGVVGIGAINRGPSLPAGIQVSNPAPTWGGSDAESVSDAEYRVPRWLRNRDRLVTAEDFSEIAWATPGVDLGRVEVLPLFHPEKGSVDAPGVVTLMLIPASDPAHPDNPEPDELFLQAVCNYLEPRRLVTTELYLSGPEYRDLSVSTGVEVVPGQDQGPVLDRVEVEIRRFLSPLAGGFDGRGWPLEKTVDPGEVLAAIARVPGIARVAGVLIGNGAGDAVANLSLTGLALPRLTSVLVSAGAPQPIKPPQTSPGPRRLPVPVVPQEC